MNQTQTLTQPTRRVLQGTGARVGTAAAAAACPFQLFLLLLLLLQGAGRDALQLTQPLGRAVQDAPQAQRDQDLGTCLRWAGEDVLDAEGTWFLEASPAGVGVRHRL